MSTLRQDPTTRQWAILATRREERPHEPVVMPRPELPERDPACPFCPGNEDQTPPEILRDPPGPDWRVRVVPNMYAALSGDGSAGRSGEPMFREMPGIGSHEVVIETPRHDGRMDEMSQDEVAGVVRVWRRRYRELIARPDVRAVVVFKNFGTLAGTSLTHTHSQIVATPVFLPRLLRRLDVATRYFDEHGICVYDELIEAERRARVRMVDEVGGFVAFEPWAAQTPFETWIAPTFHQGSFGDLADEAGRGPRRHPDPNADRGAPRVRRPRLQPRDVLGADERRARRTGLPLAPEADPPDLDAGGVRDRLGDGDQHRRARGRRGRAPAGARERLAARVDPVRPGADRDVEPFGDALEPPR